MNSDHGHDMVMNNTIHTHECAQACNTFMANVLLNAFLHANLIYDPNRQNACTHSVSGRSGQP